MFGRTRSHSYTINIAGHITVMRNYLKFRKEFGYHCSLTAQLNSPTQKQLSRKSELAKNSWGGGKLLGLGGGSFPPKGAWIKP